jgi:hypothetical protein
VSFHECTAAYAVADPIRRSEPNGDRRETGWLAVETMPELQVGATDDGDAA